MIDPLIAPVGWGNQMARRKCQSCKVVTTSASKRAEGKGLEPSTPCGATDFESVSSPFGYPPGEIGSLYISSKRRREKTSPARTQQEVEHRIGWVDCAAQYPQDMPGGSEVRGEAELPPGLDGVELHCTLLALCRRLGFRTNEVRYEEPLLDACGIDSIARIRRYLPLSSLRPS